MEIDPMDNDLDYPVDDKPKHKTGCQCGYKTHTYIIGDNGDKMCPQCFRKQERNKHASDAEYVRMVRAGIHSRRNK